MSDNINKPLHYVTAPAGLEGREQIEWSRGMSFCLGNAFKYIWRAEHKGGVEDLDKALWYLRDELKSGRANGAQWMVPDLIPTLSLQMVALSEIVWAARSDEYPTMWEHIEIAIYQAQHYRLWLVERIKACAAVAEGGGK